MLSERYFSVVNTFQIKAEIFQEILNMDETPIYIDAELSLSLR